MATVLEEPQERTSPTERQEGDVHTRLEELRSTLPPGRTQELFDEACNSLLASLAHSQNGRQPLSPAIINEVLGIFATRVAETYRSLDTPHVQRHEEQELFHHAYLMAADTIPQLLRLQTPSGGGDSFAVERCARALGLYERRLRDSFLEPMSFDPYALRTVPRIRTSHANLERLAAECSTSDAQIYYYLDCARMHVDHTISNRLTPDEFAYEQWGAWENLWRAEQLLGQCEHAHQESAQSLQRCFHEAMEYVCEHLRGGPLTEAS